MARIEIVRVPDIGDFKGVDVAEVLVAVGDVVVKDTPLISLESDKATMDVPSPMAGTVAELLVEVGQEVKEGDSVVKLEVADDAAATSPEPAATSPEPEATSPEPEAPEAQEPAAPEAEEPTAPEPPKPELSPLPDSAVSIDEDAFRKAYASPSVRHHARELGVDLGQVEGTGRKGRITRDDLTQWVKARLAVAREAGPARGSGIPEMPAVDFSKFGPIEEVALSKIRRVAAENLHRAWLNVPHVTQHDEADITELLAFREAHKGEAEARGFKLTPLAFILKACVAALKAYPDFNSSLSPDGTSLIRKGYYHFGVAVDTPGGLVVPVLRDVDQKGVLQIAEELAELGQRTRDRKVGLADLQGASFSVSNLGGLGGTAFTPIVNAPEVAILGVSKTQRRPRWTGEGFEPREVLPLSLSYDHRVIDGAAAARFVTLLSQTLSDIRRLVL